MTGVRFLLVIVMTLAAAQIAAAGDKKPSMSLNYGHVEWTYTKQKPDGSGLTASQRVQHKAIKIKPAALGGNIKGESKEGNHPRE